jgi:diguanylate cyclase (GGDEF)-like protein
LISGERPVLAVARVISPGQNTAVKLDNRKPSVTILGDVLTEAKIDQLRKALNLKSLRFSLASAKPATEDVIFRTADGTTAFVAELESATVGSELLRAVIPSFIIVAAAFGAFFVFLAGHGVRKAEVTSQSHRHLEKQALYDAVTGLPNRLFFTRRLLETQKMSAAPPAVLFLDLDRFKPVNDLLGHAAGDCVLWEVARRMQSCIEPQDLCARLGGDEFAIIVPRQDDVAVRRLCKRIIHSVSATILYASNQISVGVSIGVTRVAGPDEALEEVLRRADKALYAAKAAGRQTFRWYEEPHSDARVSA